MAIDVDPVFLSSEPDCIGILDPQHEWTTAVPVTIRKSFYAYRYTCTICGVICYTSGVSGMAPLGYEAPAKKTNAPLGTKARNKFGMLPLFVPFGKDEEVEKYRMKVHGHCSSCRIELCPELDTVWVKGSRTLDKCSKCQREKEDLFKQFNLGI